MPAGTELDGLVADLDRRRIIEATLELHGEQGIAATSWDDIAKRAGVGVGTVYRRFSSLDELIPACGEMRAIRNEPDVHPNVAEAGKEVEASLAALVDAALEPFVTTPADRGSSAP